MANELTAEQQQFIEWLATPKKQRKPATQKAFAASIGTHEVTVCEWKRKPELMNAVRELSRAYLKDELPDIYSALIEKAKTGDVPAIKLAMEMTGEYVPKTALTSPDGKEPFTLEVKAIDYRQAIPSPTEE